MGKSPGKWIKTLFGKRSSRSHASRERAPGANNQVCQDGDQDFIVSSHAILEPVPVKDDKIGANIELGKDASTNSYGGGDAILPGIIPERPNGQGTSVSNIQSYPERVREERAALKVQSAFRGYLARRAFYALKGIIRLQALMRGHLVRRQAISTLHCMWGILKIQNAVHGKRLSHFKGREDSKRAINFGMSLSSLKWKPSINAFVRKLLSLSIASKPLVILFLYHSEEPNSAWSWLKRWTASRFWKLPSHQKKAVDSNPQHRHCAMEMECGRPKRSVRRNFGSNTKLEKNIVTNAESEKSKRNIRKFSICSMDDVQENPQSELAKVKHNLRKISNPMGESSAKVEGKIEKPKLNVLNHKSDVLHPGIEKPMEEMNKDAINLVPDTIQSLEINLRPSTVEVRSCPENTLGLVNVQLKDNTKKDDELSMDCLENVEITSIPIVRDALTDAAADNTTFKVHGSDNHGKEEVVCAEYKDLNSEEPGSHENNKASKRGASLYVKSDSNENGTQSTPVLPSFMATTESTKAKARGQHSPRLSSEGIDKSTHARRHSLPSPTNRMVTSLSPRTQRLVPTSCKGVIKSGRPPLSPGVEAEKPIRVGWRR